LKVSFFKDNILFDFPNDLGILSFFVDPNEEYIVFIYGRKIKIYKNINKFSKYLFKLFLSYFL
jgi:hypothetical protein